MAAFEQGTLLSQDHFLRMWALCLTVLLAAAAAKPLSPCLHFTPPLTGWPYTCVWNSPTTLCDRFGVHFNLSQYGILQNSGGVFEGDKISIFYGIGSFPTISHSTGIYSNGGIPQLGNLTYHLQQVEVDINHIIPNTSFNGLAVIDFEAWRPLFKHNFDWLKIYQKASEELVRKEHPNWTNSTQIYEEAEKEFNAAAERFFLSTIQRAQQLRPQAYWGYYGFPRCYGQPGNYCSPDSQADNDRLQWLWNASTALYPRIYLHESTNTTDKVFYLMSIVHEAVRVSTPRSTPPPSIPVYPYSRHSYDKAPGHFYSEEDLWLSHAISSLLGSAGVVIWGSTKSTDKSSLCSELESYVSETFGPFVQNFTNWAQQCSKTNCSGHGQCVTNEIPAQDVLTRRESIEYLHKAAVLWVQYFTTMVRNMRELVFREGYSCQCFDGWTGQDCSMQEYLTG